MKKENNIMDKGGISGLADKYGRQINIEHLYDKLTKQQRPPNRNKQFRKSRNNFPMQIHSCINGDINYS